MTEPLFKLNNVVKKYHKGNEDITIFEQLSLTINQGDFIAIMGPSGSGKTTLLNMLGGLDQANDGSIQFLNQSIESLSESELSSWRANNVGFIFQFYNLMPVLTAAKNVELPLLLKKLNSNQRSKRVMAALQLVGLADRAKHLPIEMSGGQQQRVSIARAIVADPKLLLCDEPTGDLDRKSAEEILDLLKTLNKEHNKTIVMVTHDPMAAATADKTWHLNKGQFEEKLN